MTKTHFPVLVVCGLFLALPACGGGSSGGGGANGANGGSGGSGSSTSSGTGGSGGGVPGAVPDVGGCPVFTVEDDWNKDVSGAPVDATWTAAVQAIAGGVNIHPDFGGTDYGIPINVVPASQPNANVSFDDYPDESDPGPYPFLSPPDVRIEGNDPTACGGDCHLIVVQQGACTLYEGYACQYQSDGWHCGNGAKWDLTKNSYGQRPAGWTSADAAGLPIMPGLLRYDEVQTGVVKHAIRFTMNCSTDEYVEPATHFAKHGSCANPPPMGLRVRLNADFDASSMPKGAQVVVAAMKKYGMILADNGSNFYFQGDQNGSWSDAVISALKKVPSSAFEVVKPGPLGG